MRLSYISLFASGALAALAWQAPAAAQEATAQGQQEVAPANLEEVVVTARRREERLQDVPVAVSSFSGESLEAKGVEDVSDLDRVTPSLKFNQQMGGSTSQTVSLRGQSQADILLTTDSSVGIYTDEVNVPRTVNLRSAMFDVDRVEVLRGPQGTLYGRNTTGGAISIVSRAPDFDGVHGFLEGSYGNYNDVEVSGAVNFPVISDTLAVRLAGQYRAHDGYAKDRFTGLRTADEESKYFRANVLFRPSDALDVAWTTDWGRSQDNGFTPRLRTIGAPPFSSPAHVTTGLINYSVFNGFLNPADIPSAANGGTPGPTFVSGLLAGYSSLSGLVDGNGIGFDETAIGGPFPLGAKNPGNIVESWGTGLRLNADLGGLTLKSITGYRDLKRNSSVDLDATPARTLASAQVTKAKFFSQEFQAIGGALEDKLVYQVGLYYSQEKGSETSANIAAASINPNNPTIAQGDVRNISYAAYAQATYEFMPQLSLTLGARHTVEKKKLTSHNRVAIGSTPDPTDFRCTVPPGNLPITDCSGSISDTFQDPSWLVSLDYHPTRDLLLYAKASQSFRGGGTNLRATDAATFQAFGPEVAREYELGVKSELLDRRLRLNVAAFLTDYNDIQRTSVVRTSTGGVTTAISNAAAATIKGLEIEATLNPIEGLTLSGTASFLDPSYDSFWDLDPVTRLPRDRSGDDFGTFNGVPRTQLSGAVRYEIPMATGLLAMNLGAYYQSRTPNMTVDVDRTFDRRDVDLPEYTLVNARVSYRLDNGVEVAVFGDNLTDEEYYTGIQDLSSLGFILASAGEPRTYGVSLKVPFGGE